MGFFHILKTLYGEGILNHLMVYALSLEAMMDMGKPIRNNMGFTVFFPILANLYGIHLSPERAHVIADLILRAKTSQTELSV